MGQLGHLHGKRQHCERERSRNGNSHGQFAKENSLGANEGVVTRTCADGQGCAAASLRSVQ
eukprot:586964-Rhodomonas_salina.2